MNTRGLPGILAPRYQECLASGSTVLSAISSGTAVDELAASADAEGRPVFRAGPTSRPAAMSLGRGQRCRSRCAIDRSELQHSAPRRFVGNVEPALGEEIF